METPTEDLCQESVSRRTQSDECGTVLTAAKVSVHPSLHACLHSVTPTAVKSM